MYIERFDSLETVADATMRAAVTYEMKMFVHSQPGEAEKEVSEWLKTNPVNLHHIAQSQSERGGNFVFVVSLFYSRRDDR